MKNLWLVALLLLPVLLAPSPALGEDDFSDAEYDSQPTERRRRRRDTTPVRTRERRDRNGSDNRVYQVEEDEVDSYRASFERPNRESSKSGPLYSEKPWWDPQGATESLGIEAPSPGSGSVLGSAALIYGSWFSRAVGMDFFLGFSKTASGATATTTTNSNPTAKTLTSSTVHSGTDTPGSLRFGTFLKFRAFSSPWLSIFLGPMFSGSPTAKTTYTTGTRAESTPNTDTPGERTITETSFGTVTVSRATVFSVGPRVGVEFYPKWFPHLGIGLSTGMQAIFGGNTTTTTTTQNRTITVTGGVEQDPGVQPTTTVTVASNRGLEGTTFNVGGTTFSFTGAFALRYVF